MDKSVVIVGVVLSLGTAAMADVSPGSGLIREHFLRAQPSVR